MKRLALLFALLVSCLASAQVGPSVTYDKFLQAAPPLKQVGMLKVDPSLRVDRWSIGCECLDRDMADFAQYGAYVGELGVGHARIQSGWAKTEKVKGQYDFAWLDAIVDGLLAQNVQPWMCLCYGNRLYGSGTTLGNAIPSGSATMKAWEKYVSATVEHFKGRVQCYEIWNEPNISENKGHPERYVKLLRVTCPVIRKADPSARIAAFALASLDYEFLDEGLKALKPGMFDIVTLHKYFENPDEGDYDFQLLANRIHAFDPSVKVVMGEGGCPSELGWDHALKYQEWTEYSQAKVDLRRMACDFAQGRPSSIFTMVDLVYPDFQQSFGLLCTSLKGRVIYKKPSFYAVRNMVHLLPDEVTPCPVSASDSTGRSVKYTGLSKDSKRLGALIYFADDAPSSSLEWTRVKVSLKGLILEEPVLVEPVTGRVFALDRYHYSPNNPDRTYTVYIWDSPVFLMERSAVPMRGSTVDAVGESFYNEF
ncbi:MAG: glycoside hydrolase [Bacteroidales bacterium]|nr:glycoside hydrolase [Bacteroidales bacterium]